MAKIEVDLTKLKEELKKRVEEEEPKRLVLKDAQFFKYEGRMLCVLIMEDENKNRYQTRATSDLIYEDQIKKSFRRLKALQLVQEPQPPKEQEKSSEDQK